jgi:hypothetical protein
MGHPQLRRGVTDSTSGLCHKKKRAASQAALFSHTTCNFSGLHQLGDS